MEPSWNLTSGPPRTTPEPIWAETPKLSAVGEKNRNKVVLHDTSWAKKGFACFLGARNWGGEGGASMCLSLAASRRSGHEEARKWTWDGCLGVGETCVVDLEVCHSNVFALRRFLFGTVILGEWWNWPIRPAGVPSWRIATPKLGKSARTLWSKSRDP